MRYFVELSFRGVAYHGWQKQENAHSIQAEIEQALSTLLSRTIEITGAGRTDTGVHAHQMVFHFDFDQELEPTETCFRLNAILPQDIALQRIRRVQDDMHARFSAQSRSYQYFIHQKKDPFLNGLSYFFRPELDLELMNQGARNLIGKKDFSCFSKSHTQTYTNDCEVTAAKWIQMSQSSICFQITANRFLRTMARAIVGTLIDLGQGKRTPESIAELISTKDRSKAGFSVPAEGLFLHHIQYPEEGFI